MTLRTVGIAFVLGSVVLGCAHNDTNDDNNNTNGANTNDSGLQPAPELRSVSPGSGPLAGGTRVTLTGDHFAEGLSVTFGSLDASPVAWISSTEVTCAAPAAITPVTVNVRVTNPDLQSSELVGGFTYEQQVPPAEVTWCDLRGPPNLQTDPGQPTPPIFGRVLVETVTDGAGMGAGVTAQIGWGPDESDPAVSTAWQWHEAVYSGDSSQLYDEYVASLTADASGDFDYAFRFSADGGANWHYCDLDGSDNGYDPGQSGALAVAGGGGPVTLTGIDLPRGSVLGGGTVTVTGAGFVSGATILFGSTSSPQVTFVSAGELTVTVPVGAVGIVDVAVQNPGSAGSATLLAAFEYLLAYTPSVDGDLSDWDPALQVAVNTVASDWSTDNELTGLYLAFDDTHLYVGIDGTVVSDNAIVAYLDTDFGAATGVTDTDTDTITDQSGAFDATAGGNAGSGSLTFNVPGFGADFVFGSKGMADALGAMTDSAGLRSLSNPGDLPWILATIDADSHALECALPLADLFTTLPLTGAQLAIVVKITDPDGQTFPNQTLPEDPAPNIITQTYVFTIFPAGTF